MAGNALYQQTCSIHFKECTLMANLCHVGMRESMIPDFVPFSIQSFNQWNVGFSFYTHNKKGSRHVILCKCIQYLPSISRVRTIIKSQYHLPGSRLAPAFYYKHGWERIITFFTNQHLCGIYLRGYPAAPGLCHYIQHFTFTYVIHIVTAFNFIKLCKIEGGQRRLAHVLIIEFPQPAILAAKPPQSCSGHTIFSGKAQCIKVGTRISKIYFMKQVLVVIIIVMKIVSIIIKSHYCITFPCGTQGFLVSYCCGSGTRFPVIPIPCHPKNYFSRIYMFSHVIKGCFHPFLAADITSLSISRMLIVSH